jgi:hypothetical protein
MNDRIETHFLASEYISAAWPCGIYAGGLVLGNVGPYRSAVGRVWRTTGYLLFLMTGTEQEIEAANSPKLISFLMELGCTFQTAYLRTQHQLHK